MAQRRDAKLLQVLGRQVREDRLVNVVIAECRLILPEAQAPQPDHNVHDGAPQSGGGVHHLLGELSPLRSDGNGRSLMLL